jgi:hypothetical protein
MKYRMLVSSLFATLASAAIVPKAPMKVSYDGYKVVRLAVGHDDVEAVNELITGLDLTTWKGAPRAGAFADIVVAPEKIAQFDQKAAGFNTTIMHEDLGASIAEESKFPIYVSHGIRNIINQLWKYTVLMSMNSCRCCQQLVV